MVDFRKPQLKKVHRHLRALQNLCGPALNADDALQEMLDFFCMLRGIKPVFVTGRGIADQNWIAGITKISRELGLRVQEGAFWDACQWPEDIPSWYVKDTKELLAPFRAVYVTKTRNAGIEVEEILKNGGVLSPADEARLLSYPECCVRAHYLRAEGWNRATLSILARNSEGDEKKMRDLLTQEELPPPETDEEKMIYRSAYTVFPAKLGSWNLCARCRESAESPSARQIEKNRKIGNLVDPKLVEDLGGQPGP